MHHDLQNCEIKCLKKYEDIKLHTKRMNEWNEPTDMTRNILNISFVLSDKNGTFTIGKNLLIIAGIPC